MRSLLPLKNVIPRSSDPFLPAIRYHDTIAAFVVTTPRKLHSSTASAQLPIGKNQETAMPSLDTPLAILLTTKVQDTTTKMATAAIASTNGDLNNTSVMRAVKLPPRDPSFAYTSLAISSDEDDPEIRSKFRPFLLSNDLQLTDWVSRLELATVTKMAHNDIQLTNSRLKVLVLYGSLRKRSYSKLLAYEISRILHRLGCDVRVYDPRGLPVKDDEQHDHPKVQELRELSRWSDGHFWVSPEQHGNLTAVFKNQIDWIPLSTGSVRPTQGRTLGLAMVSGGSQSFNTVNNLRILGRWMRMFAIPNQSSVPQAYTLFTAEDAAEGGSRFQPCGNRERLVDCVEEFVKYTIVMRSHFALFSDRFSERKPLKDDESVNGITLMQI